jgi:hypothetical protein
VKQYLERAIANHVVTLFWKTRQPELRLVKGKRVATEFEMLKQILTDERIAGRATPNVFFVSEVSHLSRPGSHCRLHLFCRESRSPLKAAARCEATF